MADFYSATIRSSDRFRGPVLLRDLHLVSAILVEIDDKWATADKAYIKWQCQDD